MPNGVQVQVLSPAYKKARNSDVSGLFIFRSCAFSETFYIKKYDYPADTPLQNTFINETKLS